MENSKLKVLIVDNEKDSRNLLNDYLSKNPGISEIAMAKTTEEALFQYMNLIPDIIFLDTFMPGRDGIDLIELLQKRKMEANIVIVSAHKDFAITAIKKSIYDFILKPVDFKELGRIINKFRMKKNATITDQVDQLLQNYDDGKKIKLCSSNSHILIDPNDITFCKAMGSYTEIFLLNGRKEVANNNLGRVEASLKNYHFFRIQRSTLVNLDQIANVNKSTNTCTVTVDNKKVSLQGSKKQIRLLCEIDPD